ncbi:hypothetical protein BBD46_19835 [Natrialba sp. SSL1]|nr:hypothetical protein BBD46_19835 [Natrialba sp. SSL1]
MISDRRESHILISFTHCAIYQSFWYSGYILGVSNSEVERISSYVCNPFTCCFSEIDMHPSLASLQAISYRIVFIFH